MGLISRLRLYFRWLRAWKTLPIRPWVEAASLYRSGRFADAVNLYRAGLRENPSHPAAESAQLDLAYCLYRSGNLAAAYEELRDILNRDPNCKEGYQRLANLQLWLGQELEAAWTAHRGLRFFPSDGDLAATFLLAVTQQGEPEYLMKEAVRNVELVSASGISNKKLQAAKALYSYRIDGSSRAFLELEKLATEGEASRESVLAYAEILIEEDKIAQARIQLKRLLSSGCEHPRVFSLLAMSYLRSGAFYNTDYAVQLATSGCQKSSWLSPREIHVLAEAYYHSGDKGAALLVASRAKEAGSRLLGTYSDERNLEELINHLASGTQV